MKLNRLLVLSLVFVYGSFCFADNIVLKNGHTYSGTIISDKDNLIRLQTDTGIFSFDRSEIRGNQGGKKSTIVVDNSVSEESDSPSSFKLKDGRKIKGEIIERLPDGVRVKTEAGLLFLSNDVLIKDESDAQEKPKQKAVTHKTITHKAVPNKGFTYILKDGTVVKGIVIAEGDDGYSIKTSTGVVKILTSSIKKKFSAKPVTE